MGARNARPIGSWPYPRRPEIGLRRCSNRFTSKRTMVLPGMRFSGLKILANIVNASNLALHRNAFCSVPLTRMGAYGSYIMESNGSQRDTRAEIIANVKKAYMMELETVLNYIAN